MDVLCAPSCELSISRPPPDRLPWRGTVGPWRSPCGRVAHAPAACHATVWEAQADKYFKGSDDAPAPDAE